MITIYLATAVTLSACWLLVRFTPKHFDYRSKLLLGYAAFATALLLPWFVQGLPRESLPRPAAQVWSGKDGKTSKPYILVAPPTSGRPKVGAGWKFESAMIERIGQGAFALLLMTILLGLYRLAKQYMRLERGLIDMPLIRRIGRVRIIACDEAPVPFSVRIALNAWIVLPTRILSDPLNTRIAISHEIQHHRQGDTLAIHLMEIIRTVYSWNPLIAMSLHEISRLQEFACDEALVGRRGVSAHAYARCLVQAAESALLSRNLMPGTLGMAAGNRASDLRRRIEILVQGRKTRVSVKMMSAVVAIQLIGLSVLAFASQGIVQAKKLSLEEATIIAQKTSNLSQIPIDMNPLVLEKLNRYIATPEGRKFIEETRERMKAFKPMIEKKIAQYGHPIELLAVPFLESGYRNDRVSNGMRAAGIWQFIPATARKYKLKAQDKVEDMVVGKDERLDPEKATEAAMRYLQHLHGLFGDWRLALKAYNEGESRVQKLIDESGSRDPWVLEKKSSTEGYLSGMTAAIILLKNPEL